MNETLKAWAQLLAVVFIIIVSILYGYPKWKHYAAVEAAQAEIDIATMQANTPVIAPLPRKGKTSHAHQ